MLSIDDIRIGDKLRVVFKGYCGAGEKGDIVTVESIDGVHLDFVEKKGDGRDRFCFIDGSNHLEKVDRLDALEEGDVVEMYQDQYTVQRVLTIANIEYVVLQLRNNIPFLLKACDMKAYGAKVVVDEPEVEVTMADIAKAMNINVDKLRIKE